MIKGMCEECGLAEECFEKRPGEFSGGQLQRIAIVRALLLHPGFLIADEIVSALDVPVQNQILELLLKMREKYGLTLLFITHDIAVMRKVADRLIVMKEGRFLGEGTYEELLAEQKEGYIRELIGASFIFKPWNELWLGSLLTQIRRTRFTSVANYYGSQPGSHASMDLGLLFM